jgi:ankyrin repeat protein
VWILYWISACYVNCKYQHIHLLYYLYPQAGTNLNFTNPDSPLVIATSKDLTECVEYLLEAGANANIPSNHVSCRLLLIAVVT